MNNIKAIIIPGNGNDSPYDKWFPYVAEELEKLNIKTINVKFPDPILARKEYWLPFLKKLGADKNTILIGHSSGAVAAMKYAQDNKILGSVLVGVYYTHLDDENEKKSGYFDDPWDWLAIKTNQKWIIEFSSTDDPYIPVEQPRYINEILSTEYYEYADKKHFSEKNYIVFPELVEAVKKKLHE